MKISKISRKFLIISIATKTIKTLSKAETNLNTADLVISEAITELKKESSFLLSASGICKGNQNSL